jgi:P2 family phage contractile tail tube protein
VRAGIGTINNVFKVYDSETGRALDGPVTLELPNFELASESFKGAGVGGEINVPAPGVMNALTATISCPIIYGALTKYLELSTTKTLDLRNEIIVNNADNHKLEKVANRWILKGPLSGSNPGSVEQASAGGAQITMQIYYAHHWLDGEDILEWDPFKFIYTVNGEDMMAETRQNILVG